MGTSLLCQSTSQYLSVDYVRFKYNPTRIIAYKSEVYELRFNFLYEINAENKKDLPLCV